MTDPQTPRYRVYGPFQNGHFSIAKGTEANHVTTIAHAWNEEEANQITAALNTADARDADYLDLFAHVFELKKQCAALMHERDMALSALDAALDASKARQAVIDAARHLRDKGLGDGKALVAFGKALQTLDTLEGID